MPLSPQNQLNISEVFLFVVYEYYRIAISLNFIVVTVALLSVNPVTNLVTCLDSVPSPVPSHRQLCAVCCALSSALHCASHSARILPQEFGACGSVPVPVPVPNVRDSQMLSVTQKKNCGKAEELGVQEC